MHLFEYLYDTDIFTHELKVLHYSIKPRVYFSQMMIMRILSKWGNCWFHSLMIYTK